MTAGERGGALSAEALASVQLGSPAPQAVFFQGLQPPGTSSLLSLKSQALTTGGLEAKRSGEDREGAGDTSWAWVVSRGAVAQKEG